MLRFFISLACVSLVACVGSSLPQPPNLDGVDLSKVDKRVPERTGGIIVGDPGSVPGGVTVWGWDLGDASPPVVARAADDGSFSLAIGNGSVVRLQNREGGELSMPVDYDRRSLSEVARPGCFEVPVLVDLGGTRTAEVTLVNGCDAAVTVEAVRLRVGEPRLSVSFDGRAELPPGAVVTVGVSTTDDASAEDILFVDAVVDGASVNYPISLVALRR